MNSPPPAVAKRLAAAAELRAAGATWDAIGRALGCHPDTCRKWATRYPAEWVQLLRAAKQAIQEDSEAEARTTLRNLLRSKSENLRRDAAKVLLATAPPAEPARAVNDVSRMKEFLAELDDADRQALDAAIDASDSPARSDSPGPA